MRGVGGIPAPLPGKSPEERGKATVFAKNGTIIPKELARLVQSGMPIVPRHSLPFPEKERPPVFSINEIQHSVAAVRSEMQPPVALTSALSTLLQGPSELYNELEKQPAKENIMAVLAQAGVKKEDVDGDKLIHFLITGSQP